MCLRPDFIVLIPGLTADFSLASKPTRIEAQKPIRISAFGPVTDAPVRRAESGSVRTLSPLVLESVLFYSAAMTSLIYPTTNLTQVEQLNIVRGDGIYVYDKQGSST